LSCHSIKSFIKAIKYRPDLIFLSPIFKTTSHLNNKTFGINNLKKIIKIAQEKQVRSSIFALGGVKENNLKLIRKMHLNGIGAIDFFNTNFGL
jgi:thiamine-phosphate pyrophosphorylase